MRIPIKLSRQETTCRFCFGERAIASEHGSVMVITLMIMLILTIMAISAINTTNIEMQISQNDKQYRQNLYRAEASMIEAAKRVEDGTADQLKPGGANSFAWLQPSTVDMTIINNMTTFGVISSVDPNARYAAVYQGIASGESLDMTAPTQLYEYDIYGLYTRQNQGTSQVVIGYRKRF